MVSAGLSKERTIKQILEKGHANIWGMVTAGRGNSKCKALGRNMHDGLQEKQAGKDSWSAA